MRIEGVRERGRYQQGACCMQPIGLRSRVTSSARHTHDDGSEPTHTYVSCVAKVIEAIDTGNYSHSINSTRRAGSTPLLIGREVRHTTAPQILSHTTID